MFCSERGIGRTSGATENDSPTGWPGVGIGILPDDQHPDLAQRPAERPQHVLAGRQVAAAGGQLGAQELARAR